MGDVSKGEGRTVLFVSHNLAAISNLCNSSILLNEGKILKIGNTESVIDTYIKSNKINNEINNINKFIEKQNDDVLEILDLKIMQNDNYNLSMFKTDDKIIVKIKYSIKKSTLGFRIGFDLVSKSDENILFRSFQDELNEEIITFNKGIYESTFIIPENILNSKIYTLKIIAGIHNNRWIVDKGLEIDFETINTGVINKIYSDNRPGLIMPLINIKTTKYDT